VISISGRRYLYCAFSKSVHRRNTRVKLVFFEVCEEIGVRKPILYG